jgi:hypothetical protein
MIVLALLLTGCAHTTPTVAVTGLDYPSGTAANVEHALQSWVVEVFGKNNIVPSYEAEWDCHVQLPHPMQLEDRGLLDASVELTHVKTGLVLVHLETRVPYDPQNALPSILMIRNRLVESLHTAITRARSQGA